MNMHIREYRNQAFINLSKDYIELLNIKRSDKFILVPKRLTYYNSNRQEIELNLVLIKSDKYSPLRTTCRISLNKYMEFMDWNVGDNVNLILKANNRGNVINLAFDNNVVVYSVSDFENLDFNSLKKAVRRYRNKGSRITKHMTPAPELANVYQCSDMNETDLTDPDIEFKDVDLEVK